MHRFILLVLLTAATWPAFGQIYSAKPGQPVTLTAKQRARVDDSLLALRTVRVQLRRERGAWKGASHAYNAALDSLDLAYETSQGEARRLKEAYVASQVLLVSQTKKTAMYRARAHRKGAVNALLSAAVVALLYGFITSK